ncbi:hypothetical protein D8S78_07885 [Natrialba swarupiae]|nr:hypothetical protein [Natrialba swarupiae]
MFSQAEITEVTRTQRYQEWFAESIAEPFRIAWSDWRTKVGLLIIAGFLLMGLVAWISSSTWFVLERIVLVDSPIANQGSLGSSHSRT